MENNQLNVAQPIEETLLQMAAQGAVSNSSTQMPVSPNPLEVAFNQGLAAVQAIPDTSIVTPGVMPATSLTPESQVTAGVHPRVAGVEVTPELAVALGYNYAALAAEQGIIVHTEAEPGSSVPEGGETSNTLSAFVVTEGTSLHAHQAVMYLGTNGYGQNITALNNGTYSCSEITDQAKLLPNFFVRLIQRNPQELKMLLEAYGLHVVFETIGENNEFESEESIIKIFGSSEDDTPLFYIFDSEKDQWTINYSSKNGLTQNLFSSLYKTLEYYISLPVEVKNTSLKRIVSAVLMSPHSEAATTVYATSIEDFLSKVSEQNLSRDLTVVNGRILNDVLMDVPLSEFLAQVTTVQNNQKVRYMDYRIEKDGLKSVIENIRAINVTTGELVATPEVVILDSFSFFSDADSVNNPAKLEEFYQLEAEAPGIHEITAADIFEVAESKGLKII